MYPTSEGVSSAMPSPSVCAELWTWWLFDQPFGRHQCLTTSSCLAMFLLVSGTPIDLELCAGMASLTKAFWGHRLRLPMQWTAKRKYTWNVVFSFTSTATRSCSGMLCQFRAHPDLLFVHVAPPCEHPPEQERERDHPLPLVQIGVCEPPPARTEARPAGSLGLASSHPQLAARIKKRRF